MQIILEKISFKNFRSYGNTPTIIEFKNGIDIVKGINGQGKTTAFVHSLVYVFYGVGVYGENLAELVNRHNGSQMYVELEFIKNSIKYLIKRGRNPNVLKLFIDGKEQLFSNNKDIEEYIQNEILEGITLSSFNSLFTVQAGNPAFSIFRMTKPQRRAVIEQLFDLSIFKEMANSTKKDLEQARLAFNATKDELNKKALEIGAVKSKIEAFQKEESLFKNQRELNIKSLEDEIKVLKSKNYDNQHLKKLEEDLVVLNDKLSKNQRNLTEIEKIMKEYSVAEECLEKGNKRLSEIKSLTGNYENIVKELENLKETYSKLNGRLDAINAIKGDISEEIKSCSVASSGCPVVNYMNHKLQSDIDLKGLQERIGILSKDVEKATLLKKEEVVLLDNIKRYSESISTISLRIEKFKSIFTSVEKLKEHTDNIQKDITILNKNISDITLALKIIPEKEKSLEALKNMQPPKMPFTKEEVNKLEDEHKMLETRVTQMYENGKVLAELHEFLKKDAIKIFKVRNAFPPLKRAINNILKYFFEDSVKITFNSELEPIIYRGGIETSYSTFSGGEKKRLDLAFLFAIREFLIGKNNLHINVLIMDELLDSELDEYGIRAAFDYMRNMSGVNIALITHKYQNFEANRLFEIKKSDKFSKISVC